MSLFAEVHGSRISAVSVPGRPYWHHNKVTELLESGSGSDTSPIPGRSSPVPLAAVSLPRSYISPTSAKRRQSLALGVPHAQTPEAVSLHPLDLGEGQHRVGDELVIAEHREIESSSDDDDPTPELSRYPWDRVDASGDCWEWTGKRAFEGYGDISLGKRRWLAHRWVWEQLVGPIPPKMQIDHRCRNHPCVNPDHLEVVTQAENIRRGMHPKQRLRRLNRCAKGHDLNSAYVTRSGMRECRICKQARARERRALRRAAAA